MSLRIILVGQSNGRRLIRWLPVFGLMLILSLVMVGGSELVFWMLSGRWSNGLGVLGVGGAVVFVWLPVFRAMHLPVDRLMPMD
jgi:hypothetical protein